MYYICNISMRITSKQLYHELYTVISQLYHEETVISRVISQLYHELYHSYITAVSRANSYNAGQYINFDMHIWNFP